MVLFDLNNVRSAAAVGVAPSGYQGSDFHGGMSATVKSVKRLSAHPWPFSVKSGTAQQSAEFAGASHPSSSFVT